MFEWAKKIWRKWRGTDSTSPPPQPNYGTSLAGTSASAATMNAAAGENAVPMPINRNYVALLSTVQSGPMEALKHDYTTRPAWTCLSVTKKIAQAVVQIGLGVYTATLYVSSGEAAGTLVATQISLDANLTEKVFDTLQTAFQALFSSTGATVNALINGYCVGDIFDVASSKCRFNLTGEERKLREEIQILREPPHPSCANTLKQFAGGAVVTGAAAFATLGCTFVGMSSGESFIKSATQTFPTFPTYYFSVANAFPRIANGISMSLMDKVRHILVDQLNFERGALYSKSKTEILETMTLLATLNTADAQLGALFNLAHKQRLYEIKDRVASDSNYTPDITLIQAPELQTLKRKIFHKICMITAIAATSGIPINTARQISKAWGPIAGILFGIGTATAIVSLSGLAGDSLGRNLLSGRRSLAALVTDEGFKHYLYLIAQLTSILLCIPTGATSAMVNYENWAFEFLPDVVNGVIRTIMEMDSFAVTPTINLYVVSTRLVVEYTVNIMQFWMVADMKRALAYEKSATDIADLFSKMHVESLKAAVIGLLQNPDAKDKIASVLRFKLGEEEFAKLPEELLNELDTIPVHYRVVNALDKVPTFNRYRMFSSAPDEGEAMPLAQLHS